MTSSSFALGRSALRGMKAYSPDAECAIDLSDNTNLWGSPPAATRALAAISSTSVARYPESYSETLRAALARYVGTSPDCIVVGCGSDDVLESSIRACAEPDQRLAFMDPSFVMIPAFARVHGLDVVRIPLAPGYGPDVARFIETGAAVSYICSPNNPTGVPIARRDVEAIVDGTTGAVIIDEAYAEFARSSFVDLVERSERVVIARTLSKAFGLAGLRVGYAIAAPRLVSEIEKARGPFKVAAPSERAALAAINEDREWVASRVADAIQCRERLIVALGELGLTPLPSAANFVLVPVSDALDVGRRLRTRGVAVRPFTALPTIGDALRITVGPWPMMEMLVAALREVLAECA
jgi:histidinol-phosphate aminotransferase